MSPSLRMCAVVLAVSAVASQASLASMIAGEPKSAITMLQEVEEQARSGGKPAFEVVEQIIIMIKQIKVDLKTSRNAGVAEVAEKLEKTKTCTKGSTKTIEEQVVKDRSTHTTCRDVENSAVATNHKDHEDKCEVRDTFLADTITGSSTLKNELTEPITRAAKVTYVESMSELYCDGGVEEKAVAKEKACSAAEEALTKQVKKYHDECRHAQAAFENAFCTWRDAVVGKCATYETCYNGAKTKYTEAADLLNVKVLKWKDELKAVEKILCYCSVWQKTPDDSDVDEADKARSSIDASKPGDCSDKVVDTAEMDVSKKIDVADYPGCDKSAVAVYPGCENSKPPGCPGTSGFIKGEYGPMNDKNRNLEHIDEVKEMIHCIDPDSWTQGQTTAHTMANAAILSEDKDESAAEGSMGQDNTLKSLMRRSPPKPVSAVQLDAQGGHAPLATHSNLEDMEVDELMGKMNALMDHINSPGTRTKDVKTALAKSIESLQGAF